MGKIVRPEQIQRIVAKERKQGKKIGVGTGHFDCGHPGHEKFLADAKRDGAILIAIVGCDWQVRLIKGPGRPYFPAFARASTIAEYDADYVVIDNHRSLFQGLTHRAMIEQIRPDYWVTPENGNGFKLRQLIAEKFGIELVLDPRDPPLGGQISSTDILDHIEEVISVFHPHYRRNQR